MSNDTCLHTLHIYHWDTGVFFYHVVKFVINFQTIYYDYIMTDGLSTMIHLIIGGLLV